MIAPIFRIILVALTLVTWALSIHHLSVQLPPTDLKADSRVIKDSQFWPKSRKLPINQLILFGSPYERGLASGELTKKLLFDEETLLETEFHRFFPSWFSRELFLLGLRRWFWGGDSYLKPWMKEQIAGVSKSNSPAFNHIADPYTRGLAYHGIHEVGQWFSDFEREDFACTLFALKKSNKWIIGRNFDFEAFRFFDEEKVMKWEFPNEGRAYLSVIWPGMVGTVSGVNEDYIYVSFNAAGSKDFRRFGTPSSLVVSDILLHASDLKSAIDILNQSQVFISDIYTIVDLKTQRVAIIEKTPLQSFTRILNQSEVVANQFVSKELVDDPINKFMRDQLTSNFRYLRGKDLTQKESSSLSQNSALDVLKILRDKQDQNGEELYLGSRRAIDALIATHSVILDGDEKKIYVSVGPSLSGEFLGFDLKKSFDQKKPIVSDILPADSDVSSSQYYDLKNNLKIIAKAKGLYKQKKCEDAEQILAHLVGDEIKRHFDYLSTKAYLAKCRQDIPNALTYFKKALESKPSYLSQVEAMKLELKKL